MSTSEQRNQDRTLGGDKEFMTTLAKGLAVLGSFGEQRPAMTLSQAAAAADLSRATARRVLLTLAELGYVSRSGRNFSLAPRILELGFAYLSTQSWLDRAEPLMKELSHALKESCSAAILQGSEIVYVARMPAPHRIMSTTIAVGTRLPAFHTSLGRIQLGFLPDREVCRAHRPRHDCRPYATRHRRSRCIARPDQDRSCTRVFDRRRGTGARTALLAVPIVTRGGENVGAINLSAHASRATRNDLRDRFLPRLDAVAQEISRSLI